MFRRKYQKSHEQMSDTDNKSDIIERCSISHMKLIISPFIGSHSRKEVARNCAAGEEKMKNQSDNTPTTTRNAVRQTYEQT